MASEPRQTAAPLLPLLLLTRAAGVGVSGSIYIGVNLEFPGAPLNNSVHAEQFLAVNCIAHGERGLDMLAVSAAPCGHCRQFYAELVHAVRSGPRPCNRCLKMVCR